MPDFLSTRNSPDRAFSAEDDPVQASSQGVTEADVLITTALASRPSRQRDLIAENQALCTLAQNVMDDSHTMLKRIVHFALDLCQADAAGVSLLEATTESEFVFRWVAIAGTLEQLEQTTIPGEGSLCGETIRSCQPQLYAYPERYFSYLYHPQFEIAEKLLIPLGNSDQPLGTLWVLSHTETRSFTAEDQRLLTSLGCFAVPALHKLQSIHQTAVSKLPQGQSSDPQSLNELSHQILNSSDDCIKVLDLEGRLLFMSPGGQALLHIQDVTPFLNTSWVNFWQESERPVAKEAIARAKAGEVCTVQGYCPTMTGEPKWWDNKISPIRGADGQVERLLCISRDITARICAENERQQVEAQLRESEEHLKAVFSQAAVGLSEISPDGCFQRVNEEFCRILERTREELLGASVADVTHPDDLSTSLEAIQSLLETGTPISIDKRYLHPDRTIVWANSSLTRLEGGPGQAGSILAVTVDLSDRIQAEENLRESEERYRTIVNQALTGVAYSLPNGNLTLVNQKYCDITGYSAAELSQIRMHDITHPDDLPHNIELYTRMLTEGTPFEIQKRYIRKDGSIVWVHNYVSPIRDREGIVQSIVAIVLDISERKRAEEASRRAAEFNAFRVKLTDSLRSLADPVEIQATASRVLGEYLGANRVVYFEVRGANYVVERDYVNGATPLTGSYPITSFGSKLLAGYRIGQTMFAADMETDPYLTPEQRSTYAAIQIRAYIGVPLLKEGEFVAGLAVHMATPRTWTPDEVALAEEVAERTWAAVERAYAEFALRKSEEKYRSLFESIDEGFCICEVVFDENGNPQDYKFLEVNPAFEKITGLRQVTNKTARELIPNLEEHWVEICDRVIKTGEPIQYENKVLTLNRWFNVNIFRIDHHQGRKFAVLITNISDRKRAEAEREQLLANERHHAGQLQGLMKAALAIHSARSIEEVLQVITHQAASVIGVHQAVTSMTPDHNWSRAVNSIYLSDKYAQWRTYDEEPTGSGIYAYLCHINRPMRMTQAELEAHPHWKGFSNAADKHPPLRGWLAAPLMGRNGQNIGLIHLSDKYEGEFNEADESILVQLAQMASIAVENTRLYEAEQQARATAEASREEAQAANRVKDEFLAVLSHELRSPLNPILGWSTLLQNKKLDEAKTAQALATIQRNAKLQSELIEDLLDVSRILRGKLSLNVAPVTLTTVIQSAMETVRLAAQTKNIALSFTVDDHDSEQTNRTEQENHDKEANPSPPSIQVLGDSTRLQQVIWNILSNAVKFTPEGGTVKVRLRIVKRESVDGHQSRSVNDDQIRNMDEKVSTHSTIPSYAQITVSDTGQGIAPEFIPYVFDYFRQANATTTRKFGGLGLGLAIVRHLVELHGGTVRAESLGEDQGATFTVRLPLLPTSTTGKQNPRSPESAPSLQDLRVLIVDDDSDSRDFIAFVLEQAGAKVLTAARANDALAMLTNTNPDILLSDIGMPDMDGYMLLKQVRTLAPEQGGSIPAIALTAYAGDLNQQQALTVGFQDHLAKPIEPDKLITTIKRLLSKQRA